MMNDTFRRIGDLDLHLKSIYTKFMTEVSRDAPVNNLSGVEINDGIQIGILTFESDMGEVSCLDIVRSIFL